MTMLKISKASDNLTARIPNDILNITPVIYYNFSIYVVNAVCLNESVFESDNIYFNTLIY